MSIKQNILDMQAKINADKNVGVELKGLAAKAIYKGFGSPEWNAYMRKFANTKAQLERLTTRKTDCPGAAYIEYSRAYLLGNGTCLPDTNKNLLQGIEGILDETLQDDGTLIS